MVKMSDDDLEVTILSFGFQEHLILIALTITLTVHRYVNNFLVQHLQYPIQWSCQKNPWHVSKLLMALWTALSHSSPTCMARLIFLEAENNYIKIGALIRMGTLIGIGAFINKNAFKGGPLFERGHLPSLYKYLQYTCNLTCFHMLYLHLNLYMYKGKCNLLLIKWLLDIVLLQNVTTIYFKEVLEQQVQNFNYLINRVRMNVTKAAFKF